MNYEIFKNKLVRKTLASWCAFATLVTMCGPVWAVSGALDSGSAVLNQTSGNVSGSIGGTTGDFNLTSGSAGVLDWSKLSLNNGEALNYNSAGSFYNVVSSAGGMSTIAGAINGTAGANVYIFNPNGIMFNAGSSVDVGGIFGALATGVSGATLDNWLANPSVVPAAIQNAEMTGDVMVKGGTIKAAQIAFAGLNVSTAEDAKFENKAVLAAGDKVAIDGFGGGTITLTIPDTAKEGDVDMLGQFADNLEAMAAGNVRAANGTLTVDGDLKVNTYGDVDVQPGAFVANNAEVSAKSITVTARGDVSVVGETDIRTTAGDLKLVSQKGQAYVLGTANGDKASIKATGGNLTISADQGILICENGALFATKKADNTKGDVVLTTTGKDVLSDDGIQIAGAKVSADNGITLTAGDGNITIKDSAEIETLSASKTLAITATKGAISEDASAKVAAKGATALTAAATEDITLEGTENDFQGVVAADGAKVSLKDKNSIQLGNITARKTLQVDVGQDIKVDNAQVLSAEEMTLTAGGTFEAKNGAVVKAGEIDEATLTAEDSKALTIDAATAKINSGAKVGASGDATVKADALTVNNAKLAAGGNMAIDTKATDGAGAVTIENGAAVASKGALTIGNAKKPATLTVEGTDTKLVAAGALTANAGKITAQDNAKVASDDALSLKTAEGALVVQSGAKVLAEKKLALEAKTDMFIDNATVAGKDEVSAKANGTVMAMNNATVAALGNVMIDAGRSISIREGATVSADGKCSSSVAAIHLYTREGPVEINGGNAGVATVRAGTDAQPGDMTIWSGEGVKIANGARVEATGSIFARADRRGIESAGEGLTVQDENTLVSAGDQVVLYAGKGDVMVQDKAHVESEQSVSLEAEKGDVVVQHEALVEGSGDFAQLMATEGDVKVFDRSVVSGNRAGLFANFGDVLVDNATLAGNVATDIDAYRNVTVQNGATVACQDAVEIIAGNAFEAKNSAVVKAGQIDEATLTPLDSKNLTIDAVTAKINMGAKVAASGSATVKTDTLTVNVAKLAAGGTMAIDTKTTDGVGAVTVQNGAVVASKGALTVGGTSKPATLTVEGTDTKLVAAGALTANAGTITAQDNAKVASDDALTLKTTAGALVVQSGAKVLAEKQLSLDSKTDMFIDNVTVAGKDEVSLKAVGTVMAMNGAVVKAGKNLTLDAETITVMSGAKAAASGDVKASAKYTNANGGNFEAGKNIVVDAKAEGEGTVIFENGAIVDAGETLAVGGEKKPERIKIDSATVSADQNMRLAAVGDTTINSAVTAGKHLTVIGKNVNQNADFTAKDGSVYVDATGGDIVMKAGTQTTAKRTTTPNPQTGEGNVLYTAAGDVRAEAGGATISADPDNNDGAAVLTSTAGGRVGENIMVKAARTGSAAEGDITVHITGDSEVALTSKSGSIALTHENGTLTISKTGIGGEGNDQVVRVDSVDATTTVPLSGSIPSGLNGLSAKQDVTIEGRPQSTLVVKSDAGVSAEQGAVTIDADKQITVAGSVAAGSDVLMTAGQDLSVAGSVTAGRDARLAAGEDMRVSGTVQAAGDTRVTAAGDLATPGAGRLVAGRDLFVTVGSSTPMINVAVGKGISARSGQRALAFRTVGGNAYPEVYGNDSETAVFIDGRVAGGNSADFSILQGYEQVAPLGNIQLTPLFSYLANFNPLGAFVDAQAPGAEFGQANMTSDKGELIEE